IRENRCPETDWKVNDLGMRSRGLSATNKSLATLSMRRRTSQSLRRVLQRCGRRRVECPPDFLNPPISRDSSDTNGAPEGNHSRLGPLKCPARVGIVTPRDHHTITPNHTRVLRSPEGELAA